MLNLPEHLCLFLIDAISFISVCGIFAALKSSTSLPVYSAEFVKDDANFMVSYFVCFIVKNEKLPVEFLENNLFVNHCNQFMTI